MLYTSIVSAVSTHKVHLCDFFAIFVTVTFGASQIVSSLSHNVSPTNQHSSLDSFSFRNCQGSSRFLRSDARPVPASLRSWGIRTCRRRVVAEMAVSTLPSSLMTLVMVFAGKVYSYVALPSSTLFLVSNLQRSFLIYIPPSVPTRLRLLSRIFQPQHHILIPTSN